MAHELRIRGRKARQGRHAFPLFALLAAVMLSMASSATAVLASTDQPNDTTQARLRFNQCVDGAPLVDVYVNGQLAANGGVAQTRIAASTSGYLYLMPGTYHVALVPTGQGIDHPFLGPLDVQVAAGHRYTVVALGQKDEPSHTPLVIDETAAYQAIGGYPPDSQHMAHITVNNIKGADQISFSLNDKRAEDGVAYGDFQAALWPAFAQSLELALTGPPRVVMGRLDQVVANPPGSDQMDCLFGAYPGANDTHTSADVSVLNAVDFLQSYTALGASTNGQTPTFSTFLAALKTTGLADKLANGGSYMLFAPTDAAFAALPKDTLAAFMADPTALGDLLRSHIVEGYFPAGSLGTNGPTGGFNRTVTTMRGTNLVLTGGEDLIVNGKTVGGGGDYTMAANGTRLFWISKLILPVTQPTAIASPPITQPATPAAPPPATPQITAVAEIPKTGAGGQQPILRELSLVILAALTLLLIGGLLWRRATHQ